jgi:hypothetical protein
MSVACTIFIRRSSATATSLCNAWLVGPAVPSRDAGREDGSECSKENRLVDDIRGDNGKICLMLVVPLRLKAILLSEHHPEARWDEQVGREVPSYSA